MASAPSSLLAATPSRRQYLVLDHIHSLWPDNRCLAFPSCLYHRKISSITVSFEEEWEDMKSMVEEMVTYFAVKSASVTSN